MVVKSLLVFKHSHPNLDDTRLFKEFVKFYTTTKKIYKSDLFKKFEKEFSYTDLYEDVISNGIYEEDKSFPIFNLVILSKSSNLSLFEREKKTDEINALFHDNYISKHGKLNNVEFLTYLELINEYLFSQSYSKAKELYKELFIKKMKSEYFYNFAITYFEIYKSNAHSQDILQKINGFSNDFASVLRFIYFVTNEEFIKAINELKAIKTINPFLYYLLGFRHISVAIIENKGLTLSKTKELLSNVDFYENNDDPLRHINVLLFISKLCEVFIFSSHSWEKFNEVNRINFLDRNELPIETQYVVVAIEDLMKSKKNDPTIMTSDLLQYLKTQSKEVNDNYSSSNISRKFAKISKTYLVNTFDKLEFLDLVHHLDPNKSLYLVSDDLLILADFYYQRAYMDAYHFATPFDEDNYRKDN